MFPRRSGFGDSGRMLASKVTPVVTTRRTAMWTTVLNVFEEYKPWNSAHTIYLNDFVNARDGFRFVSFSDPLPNSDSGLTYEDVIEDPNANTQEQGETNLAVEVFREKLRTKPEWMTDMMNLNQYGYEKDCDALMCRKHGVTDRTVRNYKAGYRQAAASFVKDWCNTDNTKR